MLNFGEIRWYAVSLFVFAANVSKEIRVLSLAQWEVLYVCCALSKCDRNKIIDH